MSAWCPSATWPRAGSLSTDGQHRLAVEPCRALALRGHEPVDVGNVGDAVRDVRIAREQARVAVRRVGVVAVHRADGALAHVAGDYQHALLDKEYHLAEIAVGEKGPELLQFGVGKDAALRHAVEGFRDELP